MDTTVRPRREAVVRYLLHAVFAGAVAVVSACNAGSGTTKTSGQEQSAHGQGATDANIASAKPGTALATVGLLTIKGRAPLTGYSRDQFGQAWYDYDRNGCDTRNDILRRDLKNIQIKAGTHGCKVLAGDSAPDPYTGTSIHFVYGGASQVDIDHVVALGDAWQTGAQGWSVDKRLQFANDPLNLLVASASANRQKGDGDTATWLPANTAYRCAYVARQVAVKKTYGLWVTSAEHDAMVHVLHTCPLQPLPSGGTVPLAQEPPPSPVETTTAPPPPPSPVQTTPAPQPLTPAPTDVYYSNCSAARAAGAAPLYRGQPGYRSALDRDGDGVACE